MQETLEDILKTINDLSPKNVYDSPSEEYSQWILSNPDRVIRVLQELEDDAGLFHFLQDVAHVLPTDLIAPILVKILETHSDNLAREGAANALAGKWGRVHVRDYVIKALHKSATTDHHKLVRESAQEALDLIHDDMEERRQ